jgi:hypothetical protein
LQRPASLEKNAVTGEVDLRQPARLPEFAAVLLDHAGRILVVSDSDEL